MSASSVPGNCYNRSVSIGDTGLILPIITDRSDLKDDLYILNSHSYQTSNPAVATQSVELSTGRHVVVKLGGGSMISFQPSLYLPNSAEGLPRNETMRPQISCCVTHGELQGSDRVADEATLHRIFSDTLLASNLSNPTAMVTPKNNQEISKALEELADLTLTMASTFEAEALSRQSVSDREEHVGILDNINDDCRAWFRWYNGGVDTTSQTSKNVLIRDPSTATGVIHPSGHPRYISSLIYVLNEADDRPWPLERIVLGPGPSALPEILSALGSEDGHHQTSLAFQKMEGQIAEWWKSCPERERYAMSANRTPAQVALGHLPETFHLIQQLDRGFIADRISELGGTADDHEVVCVSLSLREQARFSRGT